MEVRLEIENRDFYSYVLNVLWLRNCVLFCKYCDVWYDSEYYLK